jgi:hypothetical protein
VGDERGEVLEVTGVRETVVTGAVASLLKPFGFTPLATSVPVAARSALPDPGDRVAVPAFVVGHEVGVVEWPDG